MPGRKTSKSMIATTGKSSVPNNEIDFRRTRPGFQNGGDSQYWQLDSKLAAEVSKKKAGAGTAKKASKNINTALALRERECMSTPSVDLAAFAFPVPPKFVPTLKKYSLSLGLKEKKKKSNWAFRLKEKKKSKRKIIPEISGGQISGIKPKQTVESTSDADNPYDRHETPSGCLESYTNLGLASSKTTSTTAIIKEKEVYTDSSEYVIDHALKVLKNVSDTSRVENLLLKRDVIARRVLQKAQSERTFPTHSVNSVIQMTKTLSDTTTERPKKRSVVRDVNHVSHQFFHVEPCIYTHRMFQRAATIFSVLKDIDTGPYSPEAGLRETEEQKAMRRRQNLPPPPSEKIPDMEFLDAHEQIKTFELGFATLKYQKLFQEILHKTIFFQDYPDLRDAYSLVCIILYDLQSRKFQRRIPLPGETPDALCQRVEDALLARQTKLLSTIAKERIRHGAPSIEFLLPESVRHKDETKSRIPVYTWVNQTKQGIEEFLEELEHQGFSPCDPLVEMSSVTEAMGHVYRVDRHCPDLVLFPPHMAMYFKDSHWVKHGRLVQQDKSSCLAPHTVKNLLAADHDVIHVNVGTGMSTGHLASLLYEESSKSHLWAFGIEGSEKAKKVMRNLDLLGAKNTKVLLEDFLGTDPEDPRFRHVRVILIEANCSKSAITSPVQFIVSEGEDMQILGELSKAESDMGHVASLMKKHERQLKHALKFSKVSAVVYCTRSRYDAENEAVVTKSVDHANMTQGKTGRPPLRVSPPVIPFSSEEVGSGQSGIDGRFVRFRPSDKANGCFVAIISREPDEPKDASSSALAKKAKKKAKAEAEAAEGGDSAGGGAAASKSSSSTGGKRRSKKSRTRNTATVSLPDVGKKPSMKLHKAASSGAREYQDSLLAAIKKSSKRKAAPGLTVDQMIANLPPHVVRHPSPFSQTVVPTGQPVE